jgi:hypothetical protein
MRYAKPVAFELDRDAFACRIVKVEKEIADRALLHGTNQFGNRSVIGGGDRCHLGDIELARSYEFTCATFAGKGQYARPTRAGFLKYDERAGRIEQKMQFGGFDHDQMFSTFSSPLRIAFARSRTRAG